MPNGARIHDPAALLSELLRRDFSAFLRRAFPAIRGGEPIAWNWHLDAISHQLSRVGTGECRHLLVTMPPRNLKSITISVAWVAWMLGQEPRQSFVCVSYSNELSAKLARDCLALMQSHWYRELFPGTIVSDRRSATWDFDTTKGGGRLATSLTGTLTGRGGDIIIVDDPIKPEEAHSETTRNFVNQWFPSTLVSRLNDKDRGAIVVVMQRLHQFDLAGQLLEAGGWQELSLPAFALKDEAIPIGRGQTYHRKEGEVLHPERESREVLLRQRLLMGSINFDAQYQQQPTPADGNIIRKDWLKYYPAGTDQSGLRGAIVQSWDTASKDGANSDYSVCITGQLDHGTMHIIDVFRARLTFPQLKAKCIELARLHRARHLLIEDAASGTQLIQTLWSERPEQMPLPLARKPEGDKISRMHGVSAQVQAGKLVLPTDAPWLASFVTELIGFPQARHDDQADALSQMMRWALTWRPATPIAGPIIVYGDDYSHSAVDQFSNEWLNLF